MGNIGNERIVLPRLMSDLYDLDGVRYAPEGINGPPVLAYVLFIFGLISLSFARHAYAACALCGGRQDHCRAIFSLTFNFFNHGAPQELAAHWLVYRRGGLCRKGSDPPDFPYKLLAGEQINRLSGWQLPHWCFRAVWGALTRPC